MRDDAQSHISFPLKNYFKDKKVKDVNGKSALDPNTQESTVNNNSTVIVPPALT